MTTRGPVERVLPTAEPTAAEWKGRGRRLAANTGTMGSSRPAGNRTTGGDGPLLTGHRDSVGNRGSSVIGKTDSNRV